MLDNDLQVIRETQKFRYEDALNIRRGYYYTEERFPRGRSDNILVRLRRLFSSISEQLKVQQVSQVRVECVFNPVEC
jgi:hypothetical protein